MFVEKAVRIRLKVPRVPSLIFDDQGWSHSVSELDDEMLRSIGEQWTKKLIEHTKKLSKTAPQG